MFTLVLLLCLQFGMVRGILQIHTNGLIKSNLWFNLTKLVIMKTILI